MRQPRTKRTISQSTSTGPIRVSARGLGLFKLADGQTITIAKQHLKTALDNDLVEIAIDHQTNSGQVKKVIQRARTSFVGVFSVRQGQNTVAADDYHFYTEIKIPTKDIGQAKSGDKVLVKLSKWTDPKKNPLGKITRILGQPGVDETEMEGILLEHGFEINFPVAVEKEAATLKNQTEQLFAQELPRRRDLREVTTFTIDPQDAKDYDDALSFQVLANGNYEVGIHIADVSFFVRPNTALDQEASRRGTSIYLVDRTIPMLPEILSNDLCSLRAGTDRLTFSAMFELTAAGEIVAEWFGKSVIHSNKRFTYEEVQQVLTTQQGEYRAELSTLNKLAYALRTKKLEAGAITFEDEEIKFKLAPDGRPLAIAKKERTDAHKLIEDFMLLANKKVAEYVSRTVKNQPQTFIYRIHEAPDPEKIQALKDFLTPLGYQVKITGGKINSAELNRLLAATTGQPEENIVHRATVRAMQKAIYSTKNIGHYGLAFPSYTHFTSPIRRYPDLMVHRLLATYLAHKHPTAEALATYGRLAVTCSNQEKKAAEAERESVKYKQVEYLQNKIGQFFTGVISGITEHGLYVEETSTQAEGMIRLSALTDDYYRYEPKNFALRGEKTGKIFRLGDVIKIKLIKADPERKLIDFTLV